MGWVEKVKTQKKKKFLLLANSILFYREKREMLLKMQSKLSSAVCIGGRDQNIEHGQGHIVFDIDEIERKKKRNIGYIDGWE